MHRRGSPNTLSCIVFRMDHAIIVITGKASFVAGGGRSSRTMASRRDEPQGVRDM
jgi:hypothetical protein